MILGCLSCPIGNARSRVIMVCTTSPAPGVVNIPIVIDQVVASWIRQLRRGSFAPFHRSMDMNQDSVSQQSIISEFPQCCPMQGCFFFICYDRCRQDGIFVVCPGSTRPEADCQRVLHKTKHRYAFGGLSDTSISVNQNGRALPSLFDARAVPFKNWNAPSASRSLDSGITP